MSRNTNYNCDRHFNLEFLYQPDELGQTDLAGSKRVSVGRSQQIVEILMLMYPRAENGAIPNYYLMLGVAEGR